uniref:Uncharacterized protein n=1 Tax=Aegilops tauschii subsp. strangulata TaxID=200361 RepID=A0A452ZYQ9_AEGTS
DGFGGFLPPPRAIPVGFSRAFGPAWWAVAGHRSLSRFPHGLLPIRPNYVDRQQLTARLYTEKKRRRRKKKVRIRPERSRKRRRQATERRCPWRCRARSAPWPLRLCSRTLWGRAGPHARRRRTGRREG